LSFGELLKKLQNFVNQNERYFLNFLVLLVLLDAFEKER
jgi:uncharacterized membrane protein (DUF485 family)